MFCKWFRKSFGSKELSQHKSKVIKILKESNEGLEEGNCYTRKQNHTNYMSDDSHMSSNYSDDQAPRKVTKEDLWIMKNKATNPFGGQTQE